MAAILVAEEPLIARFIARQPIFDRRENVYAYELLFRSGLDNLYTAGDGEAATHDVMDNLSISGTRMLTDGRRAFINCTRQFLVDEYPTLLPKNDVALEILETIQPDDEVLRACRKLKAAGYLIVLDDFVFEPKFQPFLDLADMVKIDFLRTAPEERRIVAPRLVNYGLDLVAEKVETREQFREAVDSGYRYFQGYFFCRPQVVQGPALPPSRLHYLRLIEAVSRPSVDLEELERIVASEVQLSYRLLRVVNSAAFGLRGQVRSLGEALLLLGERELKKWVSVLALLRLVQDSPAELTLTALVRARCCEILASSANHQQARQELFLTGMFSLIDALLQQPMKAILEQLALPDETKIALLGEPNLYGLVLELVVAYERGNWGAVGRLAERLRIYESALPDAYLESLNWARSVFNI